MASWSRREVLAALAAAGTLPGWAAILGCGGARPAPATETVRAPAETVADLRAQLRLVAAELGRRFRSVALRAELGRVTRVTVEPDERGLDERARASLVLAGFDGSSWFEEVTSDLSPESIRRAADMLEGRAGATGGAGGAAGGAGASFAPRMRIDPRARPIRHWFERAAHLFDRAARVGGSRIVYRAASLEVDDSDVLFVSDRRDLAQRLVRTSARVLFLAWTGSAIVAEEAAGAGAIGLEASELPTRELERAAEGALTLFTSGQVAPGERDLLLDPSVAALLVRHGAGRGFEADAWAGGGARAAALEGKPAAAGLITLRDDPTAGAAYAGYRFDDEGWPAAPTSLIERGVVRGPLCDEGAALALRRPRTGHGRRSGPLDPVSPRASHLVLTPGTRERDELVAAIGGEGYLVEGGVDGSGDPRSWRVAVRARRAREIARGRLTGRVYGPVVVAGDVPALLGAVRALGRAAEVHAWRDAPGDLPVSVATPALVTRGWLGA